MSDASFNAPKSTGTRPRLSLLSSKQSGNIRLNSEEQPDPQITILSSTPDDYANVVNVNTIEADHQQQESGRDIEQHSMTPDKESQRLNGGTQNDEANKMNISKEDLIRLLSMLKSELQSKEIALAAIKCEQLKRLINPVEISRSSLANTYIELQDRFRIRDQNNNNTNKDEGAPSSSASNENQRNEQPEKPKKLNQNNEDSDLESLNILNTLLELLDRHPLLALPRDSIYCLDYNCNELSTKNYLNLKIQHLDNLINQHRRFRYYMNERLKRSEQRYLDLTRELEIERNSKYENEKMMFKTSGRLILLKHIDQLKDAYEKEKRDKQTIVMTLLNELLDERERADELAKKLATNDLNSAGEKEKLIMAEAKLLNTQQSMVFSKEKSNLQAKVTDLETENKSLRAKLEQRENRIAAMLKSASANSDTKESNQSEATSPGRSNIAPKQVTTGRAGANQGTAVPSRSNIGATSTRSSPPSRTCNSSSITVNQGLSGRTITQSVSSNGSPQASTSTPRQAASSSASTNTRCPAPPVVSRLLGGSSTTESPVRIQPLFKSASVLSTNQQVRNLKTSANSGNGSSSGSGSSSRASSSVRSDVPLSQNSPSSSNQPVTKPQVPAKPAQLLDQQRNSFN